MLVFAVQQSESDICIHLSTSSWASFPPQPILSHPNHQDHHSTLSWAPSATQKLHTAAAAKSLQSCPTLCDSTDGSPPGSPIPGILQARTLEWVAISFSNVWKWKVKVKSPSRVRLLTTPWTAAHQAPPPVGFSRQEYWSEVPLPSPNFPVAIYFTHGSAYIFICIYFLIYRSVIMA